MSTQYKGKWVLTYVDIECTLSRVCSRILALYWNIIMFKFYERDRCYVLYIICLLTFQRQRHTDPLFPKTRNNLKIWFFWILTQKSMYIQPRYRWIRIHKEKVGLIMTFASILPLKLTKIAIFGLLVHFLPVLVP